MPIYRQNIPTTQHNSRSLASVQTNCAFHMRDVDLELGFSEDLLG